MSELCCAKSYSSGCSPSNPIISCALSPPAMLSLRLRNPRKVPPGVEPCHRDQVSGCASFPTHGSMRLAEFQISCRVRDPRTRHCMLPFHTPRVRMAVLRSHGVERRILALARTCVITCKCSCSFSPHRYAHIYAFTTHKLRYVRTSKPNETRDQLAQTVWLEAA